uniref:Transcription initiation factor TFIID subunit 4B n=2 Tax=Anthurium amnicola TaxID=1678845 RepID=A0A1D1YJ56_9ARAE
MNAVKEEREVSLVSIQAVNKQQQHSMHPPSSVASLYGGKVNTFNSHMLPRPPGTSSVASRKSQAQDSQIRQLTPQGIVSTQSVASLPMNVMNASKYEVQNIATETNRHGGSVSHFTSHLHPQQSQVTWQSSAIKEQKSSTTIGLSTLSVVKQEVSEQTGEQQSRPQFPALQGSFGTMHIDQASPAPSSSKDETVEKQASKITFSASTSTVMTTQMPGSMTSQLESGLQIRSQIPSAAPLAAAGTSTRTPQKKPSVGQKKPLETQATPPSASKKQKVSGAYLDQSIEQLNDVTAVSGVNLREEEEQLLSAPKEESRASEATRRVVQEEEERLILQKAPLQRKLVEIMSKCGIKNINTDVERCISLSVEERLRGLISNLIRVSRQRVDIEKARHRIVFTSDVRRQILMMSKKAKEEWEKKQAEEAEKLRKQNESEGNAGTDAEKEKDEGGRSKPLKATKEEDDKMRTTAANVAARAAVGGDDMLSKWQLMAEQARQKREGGLDTISGTQPERTSSRKPSSNFGRASREVQEAEKKGPSVASAAGSMRKFGRIMLQPKVVCSVSTKDVVSILEREPQMAKSALIYRLYERVTGNFPTE